MVGIGAQQEEVDEMINKPRCSCPTNENVRMALWDAGYVRVVLFFHKHRRVLSWQTSMVLL